MVTRRRCLTALAGGSALSLAGCLDAVTPAAPGARGSFAVPDDDGYVDLHATGNPVAAGRTDLRDARRTVVYLGGTPRWVAGVADGDASLWAVVLDDTSVLGFRVARDGVERVPVTPSRLQYETLPVVRSDAADARGVELLTDPWTTAHSRPVRVGESVATVLGDGRVSVRRGGERRLAAADALSDARPVAADGRVAVLAGRTSEGDEPGETGAEALSLVSESGTEAARLAPPDGGVFGGVAPMAADVDGDGEAEFVTAARDAENGARIAALDVGGDHLVGPAGDGDGSPWRRPLAVAPFGPDGSLEVAAATASPAGGAVEFYRPRPTGGGLELVGDGEDDAEDAPGYAPRAFGGRTLAEAVGGRFAGDDRWCLLVPTGGGLSVLRRTGDGVETVAEVSLPAVRRTNLGAVGVGAGEEDGDSDGGDVHLAVGTADGLAVWTR